MRIRATGVAYTPPEPEDPSQSSLTLNTDLVSSGSKDNGQSSSDPGQGLFLA